jgi:hypothetical protein
LRWTHFQDVHQVNHVLRRDPFPQANRLCGESEVPGDGAGKTSAGKNLFHRLVALVVLGH